MVAELHGRFPDFIFLYKNLLKPYIKKTLKNFLWLIFDKLVLIFLSLLVLVEVANHFGPSEYGLYQYALSLNLIFGVVTLFVDGKVVKKLFSKESEFNVLFNTAIARLALSLLSLIIGIVLLLLIDESQKFNLIYLLLLANNIVINLVFGIEWYFDFHLKSKNVVIASNIANIVSAVLQIAAVSLNLSIVAIAYVVIFSSLIKASIIFYQFNKYYYKPITLKTDKILIFSIIKESAPLAIAAAAAMIYARTDLVMIGAMLNLDEVGIYSISVQMMSAVIMAIVPIQISIYPKMLEWYKESLDTYYKKYQAISLLITWLFIIGAAVATFVAPFLFDLLFSNEYSKSAHIFIIHLIGALFIYNAALRSSHFTIAGYTKVLMISQIIAVFMNILLNYILIPKIGITGAAVATVITQFYSLFLSNLFYKKSKNIFFIQLKSLNLFNFFKKGYLKETF